MKVSAFSVETSDADSGFRPVPETDFPPPMETKEDNHRRGIAHRFHLTRNRKGLPREQKAFDPNPLLTAVYSRMIR